MSSSRLPKRGRGGAEVDRRPPRGPHLRDPGIAKPGPEAGNALREAEVLDMLIQLRREDNWG